MRKRRFRFADQSKAIEYMAFLTSQEIDFGVYWLTHGVDVETPFDLQPSEFPNPRNLV